MYVTSGIITSYLNYGVKISFLTSSLLLLLPFSLFSAQQPKRSSQNASQIVPHWGHDLPSPPELKPEFLHWFAMPFMIWGPPLFLLKPHFVPLLLVYSAPALLASTASPNMPGTLPTWSFTSAIFCCPDHSLAIYVAHFFMSFRFLPKCCLLGETFLSLLKTTTFPRHMLHLVPYWLFRFLIFFHHLTGYLLLI